MSHAEIWIILYAISFVLGFFAVRAENTFKETDVEWGEVFLIFVPVLNILHVILVFSEIAGHHMLKREQEGEPFLNRVFSVKHPKAGE